MDNQYFKYIISKISKMKTSLSLFCDQQKNEEQSTSTTINFESRTSLSSRAMLSALKSSKFSILKMKQFQSSFSCLQYSLHPSKLLKWLFQKDQAQKLDIIQFIHHINNQTPTKTSIQKIKKDILSQNNYIGNLMKKGFLYYLFLKYQVYNYTDNSQFIPQFERDMNWAKQYFSNLIVKSYERWIVNQIRQVQLQLMEIGVVEILCQFKEWEIIYAIFNKCINKNKRRLNKQNIQNNYGFILEEKYKSQSSQRIKIPLESIILLLQQFNDASKIKIKLQKLQKISTALESEIRQYKKLSPTQHISEKDKIICLECCIYSLRKQITQSLKYLEVLMGTKYNYSKFISSQSRDMIRLLYTASYILEHEYYQSHQELIISQKYIDFKIPKVLSTINPPFVLQSIKIFQRFSTENSDQILFSTRSLIVQSFAKIDITSKQNNISIGVCNKNKYKHKPNRNSFLRSKYSIMFDVKSQKVYSERSSTLHQTQKHIYRIQLKIINSQQLQWIINDSDKIITANYKNIVNNMDQLFACICFQKNTQFRLVEF